jgi:hypothetical protein
MCVDLTHSFLAHKFASRWIFSEQHNINPSVEDERKYIICLLISESAKKSLQGSSREVIRREASPAFTETSNPERTTPLEIESFSTRQGTQ